MTTNAQVPVSAASSGRNALGRFAVGNQAGRGNPTARRMQALRAATLRAFDAGDVAEVLAAMRDEAVQKRDSSCAKVFIETLLGRPRLHEDDEQRGPGATMNLNVIFGEIPGCSAPRDPGVFAQSLP